MDARQLLHLPYSIQYLHSKNLIASSTRRNATLMFEQVKDLFEAYPPLLLVVMFLITGGNILALILLDRRALRRAARECRELERLFYS